MWPVQRYPDSPRIFDLSPIAALGILFYLIMDIVALGGFVWVKRASDPFVIGVTAATMIVIAIAGQIFLKSSASREAMELDEGHGLHH